jgi:aerobic carbon-monoxide dehydrogenase medium subunit
VRDLAVLESDDDAESEADPSPGGRDAGQQLRHLDVVREREDELVDDLALADRPGDGLDVDVPRPLADEVVSVERADTLEADAACHDGHVIHVRIVGHRRHRGVEVHVDELRRHVVVEDGRDVVIGRHSTAEPISFRSGLTCHGGAGLNLDVLLREVEYARPATVEEAISLLGSHDGARPLAGGQTLVNVMKQRAAAPDVLVDLADLDELRSIGFSSDGMLEIGAMVTYAQLEGSSEVDVARPVLAEVAATIADVQVRNRGTIGGNVCVSDPTNHFPPLLAALDATFTIRGPSGERTISADEFFVGVYMTAVGEGELLTKVNVPPSSGAGDGFAGLTIGAHGTYIVNAGATVSGDGARVAIGCVAATPVRATAMEERLAAGDYSEESVRAAAEGLGASLDPPSDVHGSAEFRRHLAEVSAVRAVLQAAGRRK